MAKSKRSRRDIYQEVTERILELLDAGTVPWRNPIRRGGGDGWPKNLQSGKQYRGVNVFLLAVEAMQRGFSSDYWLTFKQAKTKGGNIQRGEKSSLVVFWKQIEKEDKETGEEIKLPVLRHYNVFNVEQCEDIDPPDAVTPDPDAPPFEPLAAAENIVAGYRDGPAIEYGGTRALYRPSNDQVLMPEPERFESREAFYATLYHELSHSTGISRRLNRGLDENPAPFGSPDYSREELVAEMSAAFLAATAGISEPTVEHSAAYIDNWRKKLKGDKRLVITAAGAAQKATDWILGTTFEDAAKLPPITGDQARMNPPEAEGVAIAPSTQLELF
ncbi:ArdC family protein [Fuerstiella marisgermanici]|uniref:DNA primase TraC n=1 Tax=Fuerstiella marisgermanici TaxID=1891926 RepID=A0A1P8WP88_9PLAN|nr:ArdC-like ssDNA-binding domain-containing protein [Fuerstiella marisgermanici]APZ95870.1 DNA primase TraC [Fuerstiella marisgermanici]